jgi:glycosyltransferase involved in cell wall biosynthesis
MRAQAPSASVVITCYNLERYVGPAIQSVLAQDFDGSVEVIVVDDCSTDSSAEIIQAFEGIRYLKTATNGGVLLATLAGVEAAAADVVLFLDGDDLWDKDKLANVIPRFAANPRLGFVTHDLRYADADGAVLDRPTRPEAVMSGMAPGAFGDKVRTGILEIADYVWLGSAFAVSKRVASIDGFIAFARGLPDPLNTYQDWPLAYWVAAQSSVELDYVPAKLFDYRLHERNYSGDAATPERAIRNLTRTLNTNRAILEIARMRGLPRPIVRIVERRISFCEYRIDLDRGQWGRAIGGFLRNAPDLGRRGVLAKEALRFFGVQLLGPKRFARLATKRTVLRDLPVT